VAFDRTNTPKNLVALALDDKMLYGFLVLAYSLVKTARKDIFLLVGYFPEKLSQANVDLLSTFLDWLGVDYDVVRYLPHALFSERRHLTMTTFLKFVISDELPRPHLWLDIDTVVTSGWDELFDAIDTAAPEAALIVAEKIEGPQTRFEGFNAGVLGWTKAPRQEWYATLSSLPEKRFSSEQFLFNTLYQGKTQRVSSQFNFLSSWHQEFDKDNPPRVVHFSGPLKPWHLHRAHSRNWEGINSTWSLWFQAEEDLLREIRRTPLVNRVNSAARTALFSGRLHTGKGSAASWVLRLLALLGPLGAPVVWALVARAKS
jgi:lipopolysaccharide biosynthesis glycosyltransferase